MSVLTLLDFVDAETGLAWLERSDLNAAIGAARVDQLCDDTGLGRADETIFNTVCAKAEQKVVSMLLLAFSVDEVVTLMQSDQFARSLSADIASEYMCRRKGDFASEDGKGRYFQQYMEATKYFEQLAHGRKKTAAAVTNAQEGGHIAPPLPRADAQPFIFAPNTTSRGPGGRGGFGWLLLLGASELVRQLMMGLT